MSQNATRGPKKKIVRVIEEYELSAIGEEMADLWTAENQSDRYSLQELMDLFNLRVLKAALETAGLDLAPGEAENTYNYLTNDEVPHADYEETRLRLEEKGVNVDQVLNDFVASKQTMSKYLREEQGVDFSPDKAAPDEKKQGQLDYVRKIERRYENIAEGVVESLISNGELSDDEYSIDIECVVTNKSTGESSDIKELLQ